MEEQKAGYKTSEFWLTIAMSVFGALVLLNVLNQDEAAQWMAILAPVITIVVPNIAYIYGRAKVKSSQCLIACGVMRGGLCRLMNGFKR